MTVINVATLIGRLAAATDIDLQANNSDDARWEGEEVEREKILAFQEIRSVSYNPKYE
jgi:hypothetical protein